MVPPIYIHFFSVFSFVVKHVCSTARKRYRKRYTVYSFWSKLDTSISRQPWNILLRKAMLTRWRPCRKFMVNRIPAALNTHGNLSSRSFTEHKEYVITCFNMIKRRRNFSKGLQIVTKVHKEMAIKAIKLVFNAITAMLQAKVRLLVRKP